MDDGVAAAPPPAAAAAAAVLGIISLVWIGAGMLPRSFIVVGCELKLCYSTEERKDSNSIINHVVVAKDVVWSKYIA